MKFYSLTLVEGRCYLEFPDDLSPDSLKDFDKWMRLILKSVKSQLKVNLPFERIPQHASDPGFGAVPVEKNVISLVDIPKE